MENVKRTFIVHGETGAQEAYKEHLHDAGFRNIDIPQRGDTVRL